MLQDTIDEQQQQVPQIIVEGLLANSGVKIPKNTRLYLCPASAKKESAIIRKLRSIMEASSHIDTKARGAEIADQDISTREGLFGSLNRDLLKVIFENVGNVCRLVNRWFNKLW